MIETGVALSVAAVPEALQIGATTLICTDKTGTLTQNQMTAQRLALTTGTIEVDEADEGKSALKK